MPGGSARRTLTGLEPETIYYYRLCVRHLDGSGLCGAAGSFTTTPDFQDRVSGSIGIPGVAFGPGVGVTVDVRANPDGSDPVGSASKWPGTYHPMLPDGGVVTCLNVNGHRATVGVVADHSSYGFEDIPMLIYVEDVGPTGDRFAWRVLEEPPTECPDPADHAGSWLTATEGDLTIVDRP